MRSPNGSYCAGQLLVKDVSSKLFHGPPKIFNKVLVGERPFTPFGSLENTGCAHLEEVVHATSEYIPIVIEKFILHSKNTPPFTPFSITPVLEQGLLRRKQNWGIFLL